MPPPVRAARAFSIAYRPMRDDDLPFVADLYASTRAEEVAATGWPADLQRDFLRRQHEAQHSHYQLHYADAERLIVERQGKAVGRLYLAHWPGELRIVDISLLPDERGKGLGGAILKDVLAMAGSAGKKVSIHVEKHNPARHLYDRLGFAVVEGKGIYDLMEAAPAAAA